MKAKDTLMSESEIRQRLGYLNLKPDDIKEIKKVLEISFKAGMEEEVRGGHNSISYLEGEQVGYKAGVKETLRLAIECDVLCPEKDAIKNNCLTCKMVYAKLKERGLE